MKTAGKHLSLKQANQELQKGTVLKMNVKALAEYEPEEGKFECMLCPTKSDNENDFYSAGGSGKLRCKGCHNMRARMYTCMSKPMAPDGMKDNWALIGNQAAQKFMIEMKNKDLSSDELLQEMVCLLEITEVKRRKTKVENTGKYVPEYDLRIGSSRIQCRVPLLAVLSVEWSEGCLHRVYKVGCMV